MNTNSPCISVITVVFNDIKNIENTLLSVINQMYSNIEFIIIDGGSSDGTLEIIKKYENKISYWSSEPDKGIYDAMNKGIDRATGEWINFMNSGDIFYENDTIGNIETKFNAKVNFVYGDAYLKFANPERTRYHKAKKYNFIKYGMPFCHQSVFVRAELLKKFRFDLKYKFAADFDFFLKIYKNEICNYENVSIPVCLYNLNGVSNSIQTIKEYYYIIQKYYPFSLMSFYQYYKIIKYSIILYIKKIFPKVLERKWKKIWNYYHLVY